jgi:hypothetical protein
MPTRVQKLQEEVTIQRDMLDHITNAYLPSKLRERLTQQLVVERLAHKETKEALEWNANKRREAEVVVAHLLMKKTGTTVIDQPETLGPRR